MVKAGAGAGDADAFARESAGDEINAAAPGFSVEGGDVVPDGEAREDAVALSLEQNLAAVGIEFDSTDGGMAEKDSAEDSAPASCKKV